MPIRPIRGILLVLVLACPGATPLGAEGEGGVLPAPEDPERRAQIEQWASQLGDPDYMTRARAEQGLQEAGREALFALVPLAGSEDPEVAVRIRHLFDATLWIGGEGQAAFDEKIAILKDAENEAAWQQAYREASALGPDSERILREFLHAPEGSCTAELECPVDEIRNGDTVRYTLRITNTGDGPVWLDRSRIRGIVYVDKPAAAALPGNARMIPGGIAFAMVQVGGAFGRVPRGAPPRYRRLAPGESAAIRMEVAPAYSEIPGTGHLHAAYGVDPDGVPRGFTGEFVGGFVGVLGNDPRDQTIPIVPTEIQQQAGRHPLRILPAPASEPPLGIEAVVETPRAAAGGTIRAAVTLRNTSETAHQVADIMQGSVGIWFRLSDPETGRTVTFRSLAAPPALQRAPQRPLPPGESVRAELDLPMPEDLAAGDYRLEIGYSARASVTGYRAVPVQNNDEAPEGPLPWHGDLATEPIGIRIEAPDAGGE